MSVTECPRCGEATRQHTANFIYATDRESRAMLAPAGYFCPACPTVIIDEEMISTGMKGGRRFRRVVGIDYGNEKRMDLFRTWNGEKPTYLLGEDEQIMDMATDSELPASDPRAARSRVLPAGGAEKRKRKRKRKRKQARHARRTNRKR